MVSNASILLCVGNRLLREALCRILRRRAEFGGLRHLAPGPEALQQIAACKPEVLLLEARGKNDSELEFVRQAQSLTPKSRIILIGLEENEEFFVQAIRCGVVGFILEDASAAEVITALRAVMAGEAACPPKLCLTLFKLIAQTRTEQPEFRMFVELGLSRREQQLLPLVAQGLTNKEIAARLNLSEQTVKNHLYRIMGRLRAPDRLHLAEFWHNRNTVA
jgi:DNA-binding NarL/FixJ family response regulator